MKLLAIAIVLTLLGGCTAKESDDIVKLRLTQEFAKDERTFHECADWARESLGEDASAAEQMELTNSCLHMQTDLQDREADIKEKEDELETAKRELQEARQKIEDARRKREAAEKERAQANIPQPAPVIVLPSVSLPSSAPQVQQENFASTCSSPVWGHTPPSVGEAKTRLACAEARYAEWGEKHDGHDEVPLTGLMNLADVYLQQGDFSSALPVIRRALATAETHDVGRSHIVALSTMGRNWTSKNYEDSIHRSYINFKVLSGRLPDVFRTLSEDEYAAAVSLYYRLLALVGFDDYYRTSIYEEITKELAVLHIEHGDYPSAVRALNRMLEANEIDESFKIRALWAIAEVYIKQDDYASAESSYNRAITVAKDASDGDLLDSTFIRLGFAYEEQLAKLEKTLGKEHPSTKSVREKLTQQYKNDIARREKKFGKDHYPVAMSLNRLASLHDKQGNYSLALPLYRRTLAIHEKVLGKGYWRTKSIREALALLYEKIGEKAKAAAVRAGESPD